MSVALLKNVFTSGL